MRIALGILVVALAVGAWLGRSSSPPPAAPPPPPGRSSQAEARLLAALEQLEVLHPPGADPDPMARIAATRARFLDPVYALKWKRFAAAHTAWALAEAQTTAPLGARAATLAARMAKDLLRLRRDSDPTFLELEHAIDPELPERRRRLEGLLEDLRGAVGPPLVELGRGPELPPEALVSRAWLEEGLGIGDAGATLDALELRRDQPPPRALTAALLELPRLRRTRPSSFTCRDRLARAHRLEAAASGAPRLPRLAVLRVILTTFWWCPDGGDESRLEALDGAIAGLRAGGPLGAQDHSDLKQFLRVTLTEWTTEVTRPQLRARLAQLQAILAAQTPSPGPVQ